VAVALHACRWVCQCKILSHTHTRTHTHTLQHDDVIDFLPADRDTCISIPGYRASQAMGLHKLPRVCHALCNLPIA